MHAVSIQALEIIEVDFPGKVKSDWSSFPICFFFILSRTILPAVYYGIFLFLKSQFHDLLY